MRLPLLKSQLGPITSTSFRLASRIANTLRAGTAVRCAADLALADVVLLCVPGGVLEDIVNPEFLDAIPWHGKTVLICDEIGSPTTAKALKSRGAAVGLISAVTGLPDYLVIAGDRAALRLAKAAARSMGADPIEVAEDRMLFFQTALTLTNSLFTPLLEATVECLRQAGLEQPLAAKAVDVLFQNSLRGFKRSGRKSWAGPISLADRAAVNGQHAVLQAANPLIAEYFQGAARFSFELYQSFPELTRYNKARWKEFGKTKDQP